MPNFRPVFVLDTGESLIYGYWQPGNDPDTVSAQLMQLANASGDWTVPMIQAKEAVIYDTEQHFRHQEDPEGDAWEPLNDQYLAQKIDEGFPPDILFRTGDLKEAATSESAWQITEREIVFNSEALPFYGPYHQEGEYSAKRRRRIRSEHGLPAYFEARGHGLPQREFIGISDECADEIEAIFGGWIDGLVEDILVEPPGGGLGGIFTPEFRPGDIVTSSAGFMGALTNVPAFGGGFLVRGAGGRFVKGTFRSII